MVRVPTHRRPTHPGEMLREEFLDPMGITHRELADGIDVPYQRVNELVNGKRGVTPSTALRLSEFFGTSVGFWMNLQTRLELYDAMQNEKDVLNRLLNYSGAAAHRGLRGSRQGTTTSRSQSYGEEERRRIGPRTPLCPSGYGQHGPIFGVGPPRRSGGYAFGDPP